MKRPKLRLTLALAILLHSTLGQQQTGLFNQNPFGGVQGPIQQPLQQGFRIQQPLPGRSNINPQLQGNQGYRGAAYPNANYVPITAYQNDMNFDGSFVYGYSAGDGTTAQAQGFIKNLGVNEIESQVIQGSYSYTSPEGVPIHVTYIADENGFRAEGAHLPPQPQIPINPLNQNVNPNINPYQTPNVNPYQTPYRQYGAGRQQYPGQISPFLNQQQQPGGFQPQDNGQYRPQNQFQNQLNPQQRIFGPQQQQQLQPQLQHQQQQQQQQQQINNQQQVDLEQTQGQINTQQLQGRPNQLIPGGFGGGGGFGGINQRFKKRQS